MGGWMPGVWGTPQDAFGYPNAMLAKPVTSWENTTSGSKAVVLIRFLDFGKTIEGRADEIALFSHADYSGHGIADFLAADHQHSASPQLLTGNVLKFPFFIGIFQRQILAVRQFRADGDISQFINLAAVAF